MGNISSILIIKCEFNPINIENDQELQKVLDKIQANDQIKQEIIEKIKSYGCVTWNTNYPFELRHTQPFVSIVRDTARIIVKYKHANCTERSNPALWNNHCSHYYNSLETYFLKIFRKCVKEYPIISEEWVNKPIALPANNNITATLGEIIEIIHNTKEAQLAEDAKIQFEKHSQEQCTVSTDCFANSKQA